MAISYEGTGTLTSGFIAGNGATSINVPSHQAGDLLILNVSNRSTSIPTPSGWTLLRSDAYTPGNTQMYLYSAVFYKVAASGSETASVSFNSGAGGFTNCSARISCIRGVDTSTPVSSTGGAAYGIAATANYGPHTLASTTSTRANSWRVVTAGAWYTDTGYTQPYFDSDGTHNVISFQYKEIASPSSVSSTHNAAAADADGNANDESQIATVFIINPPESRKAVRYSYWM